MTLGPAAYYTFPAMSNTTQPARPASTGETKKATARRREVYPPAEVFHRWANGADAFDIRGGNVTTRRGEGKEPAVWIYSYNMPIGVRFLHKGKPVWIIANNGPSVTTSSHLLTARHSVPDKSRLFEAPVLIGGGIGPVSYSYRGTLTPLDRDGHARNLAALVDEAAIETLADSRRVNKDYIPTPEALAAKWAKVDLYRQTFLPTRKAITCPPDLSAKVDLARANAAQRERVADAKAVQRAALDWIYLKPEIERLKSLYGKSRDALPALRAAAQAEIESYKANQTGWEDWLNGGPRPRSQAIPSLHSYKSGWCDGNAFDNFPALKVYFDAAPQDSLFTEAFNNLRRNGTFKSPTRFCFGNPIRHAYPVTHLLEYAKKEYGPTVLDSPNELPIGGHYLDAPTLLRVGPEGRVETSRGAAVPLAIVRAAWLKFGPVVSRAAAGSEHLTTEDLSLLRDNLPYGLTPYTLTDISADGVAVGCHLFPAAEVVRFAASQGW